MNIVPKVIIVACLVVLAGYGGWFYGKGQGWDEGRASLSSELESAQNYSRVMEAARDSLYQENEALRNQPAQVVEKPVYVQQAPANNSIRCTSNSIGTYQYTNCY